MSSVDNKLDAILRCLNFYYSKYSEEKAIFDVSGDKSYFREELISEGLISAWIDFSDDEIININKPTISDLLKHLESEKLIISEHLDGERKYKIIPAGISLIEKKGHVKKQKKLDFEYNSKKIAVVISIISLVISLFTFIYTVFIKK